MAFGHIVHDADHRLREWLESHKPAPDGRLPSERALARDLELHHYAVNRAMVRLVAEGLVERRGYKLYHATSKKSRNPQKYHCDLVISQRSVHMAGYRRVARELGIDLQVHPWQSSEEAISILRHFRPSECESVVFDPPFGDSLSKWEPAVSQLVEEGVAVVCINRHTPGASTVIGDRDRGLKLLFDHFLELGHEQLAFVMSAHWASSSSEIFTQWRALCIKNDLATSAERIYLQNDSRFLPEDAKRLAIRLTKEWSKVTALAIFMDNEYPVQQLLDALSAVDVGVPVRLSLAFLDDSRPLSVSSPPVTAAAIDSAILQEAVFLLASRAIRKKREFGILPQPGALSVQPRLISRGSCAPNTAPPRLRLKTPHEEPQSLPGPCPAEFPDHPEELDAIRQRPYDLVAKVSEDRFTQIDLSAHVNRPLNFRRGWLGDLPLRHLVPGRHKLHGIPFDVLGGIRRTDSGAVVFQSLTNITGNAAKLPASLKLPIRRKVAAIYFLHGCGYAKHLNPFATYSFYAGRKKLGEVALVALGRPTPNISPEALKHAIAQANIQDWWPDYPHYEFSHARVVPLLESGNPEAVHRHVFLYTLEWLNPSPQTTVTHLTISSDVEQSTTLGLLGISTLSPAEQ